MYSRQTIPSVSGRVRSTPTSVQRVKSVFPCENDAFDAKKRRNIQASGVRGVIQFGAEGTVVASIVVSGRLAIRPKNSYALVPIGPGHRNECEDGFLEILPLAPAILRS